MLETGVYSAYNRTRPDVFWFSMYSWFLGKRKDSIEWNELMYYFCIILWMHKFSSIDYEWTRCYSNLTNWIHTQTCLSKPHTTVSNSQDQHNINVRSSQISNCIKYIKIKLLKFNSTLVNIVRQKKILAQEFSIYRRLRFSILIPEWIVIWQIMWVIFFKHWV